MMPSVHRPITSRPGGRACPGHGRHVLALRCRVTRRAAYTPLMAVLSMIGAPVEPDGGSSLSAGPAIVLFVTIVLLLGLFTRLGGLVAIGISGQLMIGLGGISTPYEWEWTYNLMVVLSILLFGLTPGRIWGVDAWLRPRLQATAAKGNRWAGWVLWLT